MDTAKYCEHCGKPLGSKAVHGLCPECFLKVGLGSGVGPEGAAPKPNGFIPPKPEELAPHFPQLEILELLGKGGMGAVYKARQKGLDRLVALKVLPPDGGRDPAFAERFTREAQALARLNHPNIVGVHEFGQAGGFYFFVMEFVDGVNLRQMLRAHRLSPREAMAIVPQICEALQYAHDQGIVHRDIKPENVLVDKQGRVKIADFGLAKLLGKEPLGEPLTRSAEVMGTPQYMAPEQLEKPLEVDHRADIYSLGVVFYEMLTGELPLGRFAAPSKKVQIDVRLDEIVLRALEKEPALRYQQAGALKTQVETLADTPEAKPSEVPLPPLAAPGPASAPPAGRTGSKIAVAAVGCGGLLFVLIAMVVWGVWSLSRGRTDSARRHALDVQRQRMEDTIRVESATRAEAARREVEILDTPVTPPSFRGVFEQVIQARGTGTNFFLDLDIGRLLTPPPEISEALRAPGFQEFEESYWRGLNIARDSSRYRYIAWLRETGADLMYDRDGQIIGFDMIAAVAHGPDSSRWDDLDDLTPQQVVTATDVVEWTRKSAEAKRLGRLPPPAPRGTGGTYHSASQLESQPGGPTVNLLTRAQSVTWAYKTREGSRGILQILGSSDNPRGMKIRFIPVQSDHLGENLPLDLQLANLSNSWRYAQAELGALTSLYTTSSTPVQQQLARVESIEKQLAELKAAASNAESPALPAPTPIVSGATERPLPGPTAEELARDLAARFEAAKAISAFTQRDAAMTAVARDAARAGNAGLAKAAVAEIVTFSVRDSAAREAARELVKRGRRAEALEIARTITAFATRDATLRELAE